MRVYIRIVTIMVIEQKTLPHPKNPVIESTMFPHRKTLNQPWTSPDGKTHNQIEHTLINRRRHSSMLDV